MSAGHTHPTQWQVMVLSEVDGSQVSPPEGVQMGASRQPQVRSA